MFVNYVRNVARPSPFNLAVARVLLGTWLAWRILSQEWAAYGEWPFPIRSPGAFLFHDAVLASLPYLQWAVVALLALFVVGYRIRLTGGLAGLGLIVMASVTTSLYLAGTVETLMVGGYLLLLFAFFAEDDVLSFDGVAATRSRSLSELNAILTSEDDDGPHRMRALRYGLLAVAIMYFGSGWGKIREGGLEVLLTGADLQRVLLRIEEYHDYARLAAQPVIHYPELALLGHVGSMVLQLSLIVAVLLGVTIAPIVVGLMGFHLMVILAMGLYFIDMFLYLALFAAWDAGYARLAADGADHVDVVYDANCRFCARSLVPFRHLDVNDSITVHTRQDAPAAYADRPDVDLEGALYVFRDGEAQRGYWALRELLRQFRIFAPVVWLLNRGPVAAAGERAYEYVAADRDRHVARGTGS